MTLYSYLWGLRLCALVMMCAVGGVIFFIHPYELGVIAYGLFYLTVFLCVSSVSALALTRLWYRKAGEMMTSIELRIALRQGVLVGVLVCALLLLQQMRMLVWWDALLVVTGILMIELHLLIRGK